MARAPKAPKRVRAPSAKVVDEAVRWKFQRLAETPGLAAVLDAIGATMSVETSPAMPQGAYRARVILEMHVNAESAAKHVMHMRNPDKFREDIAKVFSLAVSIESIDVGAASN